MEGPDLASDWALGGNPASRSYAWFSYLTQVQTTVIIGADGRTDLPQELDNAIGVIKITIIFLANQFERFYVLLDKLLERRT